MMDVLKVCRAIFENIVRFRYEKGLDVMNKISKCAIFLHFDLANKFYLNQIHFKFIIFQKKF